MMMRATLCGAVASFLALSPVLAGSLGGQAISNTECDKAATVIANGHPGVSDNWAFGALRRCGVASGRAFAAGIEHYRTESDVDALEDFMTQVDNWRDASIFAAVNALANNNAATPQARVFAVRHLILLLRPQLMLTYAGLTRKADTIVTPGMVTWQEVGCIIQMTSAPHGSLKGSSLPPDYEAQIAATLRSLSSSNAPASVRNAARCVPLR